VIVNLGVGIVVRTNELKRDHNSDDYTSVEVFMGD
jgi:hypothetical protein